MEIPEHNYEWARKTLGELLQAWDQQQKLIIAQDRALREFVFNAYEQSHGMSDFVVTTCEALEAAKKVLKREFDNENDITDSGDRDRG